ncbi:class I SAM-dependent methyltransferase [Desulfovibrio sp. QI0434]
MDINEVKKEVLKCNEEIHDIYAPYHTQSVPYQCRKATRKYILKFILKQLEANDVCLRNKKVLEIGCGTGTFAAFFQEQGANYEGMDISSEMLKFARINHPSVSFYKSSLEDFSRSNPDQYDVIISSSFLHHLVNIEEGVEQIKSMLRPGGVYIAVHEMIEHRQTKLEIFDEELSYLWGYNGYASVNFIDRLKRFIGIYNPFTLFTAGMKTIIKKLLRWEDKAANRTSPGESSINYLDYQLNFNFNLAENKNLLKCGVVIPYCYYNFIELRHISKISNHHCYIAKREM